ncbi:MAG: EutN/CcmL family microcompartment protein [Candidatus Schekmanbacteria bacterium]|nr:EutN/CcmL family microcompartment protein [Candidatus Schekmanbacteria bacterium]
MLIGKVIGRIVATRKDAQLTGAKLLIVRPVDLDGAEKQGYVVCIDTVGAGAGETVLVVSGSSARMASTFRNAPVDATIVAIIDEIQRDEVAAPPPIPRAKTQ